MKLLLIRNTVIILYMYDLIDLQFTDVVINLAVYSLDCHEILNRHSCSPEDK